MCFIVWWPDSIQADVLRYFTVNTAHRKTKSSTLYITMKINQIHRVLTLLTSCLNNPTCCGWHSTDVSSNNKLCRSFSVVYVLLLVGRFWYAVALRLVWIATLTLVTSVTWMLCFRSADASLCELGVPFRELLLLVLRKTMGGNDSNNPNQGLSLLKIYWWCDTYFFTKVYKWFYSVCILIQVVSCLRLDIMCHLGLLFSQAQQLYHSTT